MSMQPIKPLLPYIDQQNGDQIMYIRIEPALLYLEAGQTSKIKVYAVLTDGRNQEITHKVKWHSQHTTMGKVNEEGTITAVEAGSMSIVAEYEQHKAELIVSIDKKMKGGNAAKAKAPQAKEPKAHTPRADWKMGKVGKISVIAAATCLVLAGGGYAAVQVFSGGETATEQVTPTDTVPRESPGNSEEAVITTPVTSSTSEETAKEQTPSTLPATVQQTGQPTDQAAPATNTPSGTGGQLATQPADNGNDAKIVTQSMAAFLQSFGTTEGNGGQPAAPADTAVASQTTNPAVAVPGSANPSATIVPASPNNLVSQAATSESKPAVTAAKPTAPATKPVASTVTTKPKATSAKPTTTARTTTTTKKTTTKPAATPKTVAATKPATTAKQVQQKPVAAATRPQTSGTVMLIPTQKDGKWGYKKTGVDEPVIAYQFDHATRFSDGLALVKKDGKFGYINASGSVVIPFDFSYAAPFSGGKATVKKDGKLGTIDKQGNFHAS